MPDIQNEVRKRRTFAIISHPDAGKTTLTEKLLLFGGAIKLAGTVKGRKASRHATSDWMKLEQERGIRKGAAGHDICFVHPKSNDEFPIGGEGVLIELVQAPPEVTSASHPGSRAWMSARMPAAETGATRL